MKKLVVFLIIISIFVSLTVFVAFATNFNRSSSYVMKEINNTYGSAYGVPTILSIDRTGSDYEGPLYSTASTWEGYTDNGFNGLTRVSVAFRNGLEALNILEGLLRGGTYFLNNLQFETWQHPKRGAMAAWNRKDYIEKFSVDAYAYIGCYTGYKKYETMVNKLRVKVPAWLTIFDPVGGSNERDPHPFKRFGPFSKSEFVAGEVNRWDIMLLNYGEAEVDATGTNPTTEDTHSTTAFAPTEVTAVDTYSY